MLATVEHKTVQARILHYAQEIGWRFVPRAEAERRRGFDPDGSTSKELAHKAAVYFDDSLLPKPRALLSNREGVL